VVRAAAEDLNPQSAGPVAPRRGPGHRPPPLSVHVEEHAQLLADVGRVERRQPGSLRQLVVAGVRGRLEDAIGRCIA
jgi:hypothetical protein